jgi:putative IMPACT (imprinted ancient) family translation regulator
MECDYQHVNDVMKIVKNTGGNVISNENQLFCVITVAIPMASVNLFSHQVNENHFIQAHMIQSNIC